MNTETTIDITENARGFHVYGEPVICTYGSTIRVYESSAASGPHVWLNVLCDGNILRHQPSGEGTAHLNEEQARALVARLQAWLDEIPSRWEANREHLRPAPNH